MIKKNIVKKFFEKLSDTFYLFSLPTITEEQVIKNDCSYSSLSENGKWRLFWYGDFRTGFEVKVRNKEGRKIK